MKHYLIIYVIGFLITLFSLHKWKKELDIDNFDNHDDDEYYDDWDSNAQAYAVWSLGWPIVLAFLVGHILWKAILTLSKWIQTRVDEPTHVFIKRLTLDDLTIKFVLRHYWENPDSNNIWTTKYDFRRKELGLWYDKRMAVGTTKKGKEAFSESNLYPSYMFGVNLLYIKFWITVDRKVLHIKLDK
jgi:hypothetical protein